VIACARSFAFNTGTSIPSDSRSLSNDQSYPTKTEPCAGHPRLWHAEQPRATQASWFRAEDKEAAKVAAEALKFSVIELRTDAEKALTVGVHEGVLKSSGRMIVGSVSSEVYRRIDEYARKGSGADGPSKPESAASIAPKPPSEQTMNSLGAAPLSTAGSDLASPPNPWEALRVGARVLAAYWNEKREFEGFWRATVKRIENGEFTLEWFDAPDDPPFKCAARNVAILHPEFRITGK